MKPKAKNRTAIHLFLLFSLLSMLVATLFLSYVFYREYQYKQNLLCSDVTAGIRQLRTDALSDDSQKYLRYKAIKLVAIVYAEVRTATSAEKLSAEVMGLEMNDLKNMCDVYPDYKIGEIVTYDFDRYLEERSRFNREFSNMLAGLKTDQDYQLSDLGRWLNSELKK